MPETITTQVSRVEPKEHNGTTFYNVTALDGHTYSFSDKFDKDWAERAFTTLNQHLNETVQLVYVEKESKDGKFKNRYIQSVPGLAEPAKKPWGGAKVDLTPLVEEQRKTNELLRQLIAAVQNVGGTTGLAGRQGSALTGGQAAPPTSSVGTGMVSGEIPGQGRESQHETPAPTSVEGGEGRTAAASTGPALPPSQSRAGHGAQGDPVDAAAEGHETPRPALSVTGSPTQAESEGESQAPDSPSILLGLDPAYAEALSRIVAHGRGQRLILLGVLKSFPSADGWAEDFGSIPKPDTEPGKRLLDALLARAEKK